MLYNVLMKQLVSPIILFYLKVLARLALRLHRPFVIGIAGSAGKSSARNAVFAALKDNVKVKAVHGNSETGVPLGLLGFEPSGYGAISWLKILLKAPFGLNYLTKTPYIVVEMGIDEPLPPKNMSYLLSVIRPDTAVSLNVSATHTQQFEKILPQKKMSEQEQREFLIRAIAEEDTKIITQSGCEFAIYNNDDVYVRDAVQKYTQANTQFYTFGKDKKNTIWYEGYDATLQGTEFTFGLRVKRGDEQTIRLFFPSFLVPKVYQETLGAVVLAALTVEPSIDRVVKSLQQNFSLPKGRSSLFTGIKNSKIIDSTYNSSKRSVLSFFELAGELKQKTNKQLVFLCGDMNELGNESRLEHEELIPVIRNVADFVYCVGPETQKYIMPGLQTGQNLKEVKWFPSAIAAGEYLKTHLLEGSLILAKGSQNRVFLEEAIKQLLPEIAWDKLCRQEPYWLEIKKRYFQSQASQT